MSIDEDLATVREQWGTDPGWPFSAALRLAAEVDSLRLALGVHTRTVTDLRAELTAAELLIDGLRENADLAEHDRSEAEAELAAERERKVSEYHDCCKVQTALAAALVELAEAREETEDARHDYRSASDAGQACYARMVWLEARLAAQEPLVSAAIGLVDSAGNGTKDIRPFYELRAAVDAYRVLQVQGDGWCAFCGRERGEHNADCLRPRADSVPTEEGER